MGSLGRLVPWASWDEWRQVGNWLLSPDSKDVQKGIDRVAAWRARGRLPLGVDITACLVETRARDPSARTASLPQQPQPQPPLPDSQLQLQYAMALVRMVNGIADSSQKGRVAASVASLAAAAGLPRILVDLRHESTHNELPSAASLRLAAEQALAWLTLNYWQRQAEHLGGCMVKVQELVQEYVSLHAAAAAKVASKSEEQQQEEEEEALASQARSSAAAAAAAVASGRRRGAARGQAAAEAAGGSGAGAGAAVGSPARGGTGLAAAAAAAGGGYSGAEGQRRRKALLSELKMGVPRPAAALLVGAVLSAGASAATLAAAGGDAAALERALATALPHLLKDWPQLPDMLLKEAVERLAAAAATAGTAGGAAGTAGPASGPAEAAEQRQQQQLGQEAGEAASHEIGDSAAPLPAAAYLAWVTRLLPQQTATAAKQAAGAGAAARAPGGLVPGWAPPVPLLQQLVAGSLGALASCAQRAALDWVAGSGADGSKGSQESPAAALAALQSALRALLDCWRSAGSGSATLARCSALVAAAGQLQGQAAARREAAGGAQRQQQQQQQQQVAAPEGGESADALGKLVLQLRESAEQLRQLREQKKRGAEEGAGSSGAGKRWRRAVGWAPCALGNLPSRDDPNGRLAPREEPLPEPSAEAQAALAGGSEGSPEQLLIEAPTESAGPAAAAAEQDAQGRSAAAAAAPALGAASELDVGLGVVWPLDDGRLAWGAAELDVAGLGRDAVGAPAQPVCVPPLELLL